MLEGPFGLSHVVVADSRIEPTIKSRILMPYNRNKNFVDRRSTLEKLEKLFFNQNCQKIALFGLGGIGKTQLAIEFVCRVKKSHPEYSIFWESALSAEAFRQSYNDIAIECDIAFDPKIEDLRYGVKRYLHSEISGKWFMIVENADDKDLLHGSEASDEGILDYIPEKEEGLVLLTTRNAEEGQALAKTDIVQL